MNTQTRPETFRLRAGNFNLLVLRLLDHRPDAVLPSLGDQFRRAPGFLRFAPIAIGLGDLEARPDEVDFKSLVSGLRSLEIVPIGTTGGIEDVLGLIASQALLLGFAAVCFLKGKLLWGVFGIYAAPIGLYGAVRLAKPNSWWARHRYDQAKLKRSRERYSREAEIHKPAAAGDPI